LLLALGACTSTPRTEKTEVRTYDHAQLSAVEQRLHDIDSDGYRTKGEIAEIAQMRKEIAAGKVDEKADDGTKQHYGHVKNMVDAAGDDAFKSQKFYVGFTGVDTKVFNNVPGNIGITNPLEAITGAYLVEKLGEKRAYELMSQVKPVEEFKGLPVSKGDITEGGGRIQGLQYVGVQMTREDARKLAGTKGIGRVDAARLEELFDGKTDNGEMYQVWLIGETNKGYALPKADK
jgi:hypothetical protein